MYCLYYSKIQGKKSSKKLKCLTEFYCRLVKFGLKSSVLLKRCKIKILEVFTWLSFGESRVASVDHCAPCHHQQHRQTTD